MAKVLMTIKEMKDRALWLQKRKEGIGGSDIAVIMGLNPWKSPYTLWAEKTGLIPIEDLSKNQRVYWGQKNEAAIADWFAETTGKIIHKRGLLQSCKYPWMLATVDRQIINENAGLEIKTAGIDQYKEWANDAVPAMYVAQCQWYMAVTGCTHWYIAVLIGGNDARWTIINRDDAYIKELIAKAKEFWDMVQNRIPPAMDGTDSTTQSLKTLYAGGQANTIVLDDKNVIDAYHKMKQYEDEEETAKKAKETCRQTIMDAMKNYEIAEIDGNKVTWKTQAGKTSFDTTTFKKDQPGLYDKYKKTGNPTRVFRAS